MPHRTSPSRFDTSKFEYVHQIGGIRTATLDGPGVGSPHGGRVALVDTGSGLRFTVALDRGGDIVDAKYNQHSLVYLSPNGLVAPNHAYHFGLAWLRGWAGGLVTTCGPEHMGGPRVEDGVETTLHGRFSNMPAAIEMMVNPDPHRGIEDMMLSLIIRDAQVFGPVLEIRRLIRARLGEPEIIIDDEVLNRGNVRTAHHYLYHCNFGYPLLDRGTRLIFAGKGEYWQVPGSGDSIIRKISDAQMNALKRVPDVLPEHAGSGERGVILDVKPQRGGAARIGLINENLSLGVELQFPTKAMPRLACWQHYGPAGAYVCGLEPFSGSLLGKAKDNHPTAEQYLEPGESRKYSLRIRALTTSQELKNLAAADGPVGNR